MSNETLFEAIRGHSNDYSTFEDRYRGETGRELVLDPLGSPGADQPAIGLTVSVVIAAWNAIDTIARCLTAIEQSSFNLKYPHLLEVVVVDDGSTDGTWNILQNLELDLTVMAVNQDNLGQTVAMNTGLSAAGGEIIISCDADMILTVFAIEELVRRHQALPDALLVGFRYDMNSDDPGIDPATLRKNVDLLPPSFHLDNRLTYHWDGHIYPGWPENMCRETGHFKDLGHDKKIYMSDGDFWSLPRMVYGALFSMRRDGWERIGGFDERFKGWGWSDTFVGAKALGIGHKIIPVYSATGVHVAHKHRTVSQATEGRINRDLYNRLLQTPLNEIKIKDPFADETRIRKKFSPRRRAATREIDHGAYRLLEKKLEDPWFLAEYFFNLGRCEDAVSVYGRQSAEKSFRARAFFRIGSIRRWQRQIPEAIEYLVQAAGMLPDASDALLELALAHASAGEFALAKTELEKAYEARPCALVNYVLRTPIGKHIKRGKLYEDQEYYPAALRDFEAALIKDPANKAARQGRDRILMKDARVH